jgi:hypothetical protein
LKKNFEKKEVRTGRKEESVECSSETQRMRKKTAGEESHIIELAAGNLTEIKNIFQPCRAVTG